MTVSPAMRRYAAEIYRLQQDHEQVSLSVLSSHVESSAQAISTMVKRLNKNGYLVHEPYRGVRLTLEGEKIAMPALRRHRLTEVFLVRVMKYDWAAAHELSDVFERGVNDEIEDRMDELAGHPSRCPHGEPIPSKEGVMPKVDDIPLTEVPSGSDCVISRVRTHDMEKLHYIGELGLIPGAPFHLLSCAPFKGPLRLQMKPQDHMIGYELASSLWVEVSKRGKGNKLPPLKISGQLDGIGNPFIIIPDAGYKADQLLRQISAFAIANADAGTKKVFEALVDDEERHFSQYDLEMEKIEKFGEQFLALQSMEGSKAIPTATAEA